MMEHALAATATVSGALGLVLILLARGAARRRAGMSMLVRGLAGALFLTFGALLASIGVSMRGYRALTHEEIAATVRVVPHDGQNFRAAFTYPDGGTEEFDLAGDSIAVDAHILKWHPWANLLGLHTSYRLDRVAGRYDGLEEERGKPRTVFALRAPRPPDIFDAVRHVPRVAPLLDAAYGSATFVAARAPAEYEIRVSTTGLLARPVGETAAAPAGAPASRPARPATRTVRRTKP